MDSQSLEILYEDNHLLAINKNPGMLVQGDVTGDVPLVELAKEYIKKKYHKKGDVFLGVVHRLDRPVSGVVIFARTSKALERMNSLFRNRDTQKTYWAIVSRRPPNHEATLIHWLRKDEKKNKTTIFIRETADALKAELSFKVLGEVSGQYLLEVKPITGRSHQIRVQLSSIGCPIRGDVKYGHASPNENGNINLHAKSLGFMHPVKKDWLKISAPFPDDGFWHYFASFEVNDGSTAVDRKT